VTLLFLRLTLQQTGLFCRQQTTYGAGIYSKFAGSIADEVIEIFHSFNPTGHTMALCSNRTLTEMSTRDISWG